MPITVCTKPMPTAAETKTQTVSMKRRGYQRGVGMIRSYCPAEGRDYAERRQKDHLATARPGPRRGADGAGRESVKQEERIPVTVARVTWLKVKNYRALRDVTLSNLTPLTVLLGPNGSGGPDRDRRPSDARGSRVSGYPDRVAPRVPGLMDYSTVTQIGDDQAISRFFWITRT